MARCRAAGVLNSASRNNPDAGDDACLKVAPIVTNDRSQYYFMMNHTIPAGGELLVIMGVLGLSPVPVGFSARALSEQFGIKDCVLLASPSGLSEERIGYLTDWIEANTIIDEVEVHYSLPQPGADSALLATAIKEKMESVRPGHIILGPGTSEMNAYLAIEACRTLPEAILWWKSDGGASRSKSAGSTLIALRGADAEQIEAGGELDDVTSILDLTVTVNEVMKRKKGELFISSRTGIVSNVDHVELGREQRLLVVWTPLNNEKNAPRKFENRVLTEFAKLAAHIGHHSLVAKVEVSRSFSWMDTKAGQVAYSRVRGVGIDWRWT